MTFKIRLATSAALLAAMAAPAMAAAPAATVRPQDDLFRAINGHWLDTAKIPGDKKAYGTFMILREQSNEHVRGILEAAAKNPGPSPEGHLIGDFYAALLDEATIEKHGLQGIQADLDRIDAIKDLNDVATVMGQLGIDGVSVPVEVGVGPDPKNPMVNAVVFAQSGIGLPNRDYYVKDDEASKKLRMDYVAYLATLNNLSGVKDAAAAAHATMDIEMALAKVQWTSAERRDAVKTYNPAPRDTWNKDYPGFNWEGFAGANQMPGNLGSIVREPSFIKAFATMFPTVKVADWKAYLRTHLIDAYSENLPRAYREANYHFRMEKLQGLTARAPRWRTAVETCDNLVGEAIGQRYVAQYFPPAAKAQMKVLVGNLLACYRDGINHLEWMSPATRVQALAKLSKLRVKVGYPDKWRGYKGLTVSRDDAAGDMLRANRFLNLRDMSEAGKAVDRSRWDMTPQTVNAYYNPVGNEIVFPAAILQPPFFDPKTDDAYNYGAIGAVIGHETSHGFDDQGRRFDADGKLRDWWTPADEKNFTARAERLVAQYNAYEPLPGQHVDGKLTLGENIADLAGLKMALNAYHRSLHGKKAPVIKGTTGEQRFFIGFARVWRGKSRPEYMHMRLVADPHSPEQFRTNGVVSNIDAFYDAFGVKPGDGMYKKPADRVRIW